MFCIFIYFLSSIFSILLQLQFYFNLISYSFSQQIYKWCQFAIRPYFQKHTVCYSLQVVKCRENPNTARFSVISLLHIIIYHSNTSIQIQYKFYNLFYLLVLSWLWTAYLSTVRQTANKLKAEFEVVLKRCSEKLTEMCKVEKGAWLKLDQLEQDFQELIKQVETKARSLVSLTILQNFIYYVTLFHSLMTYAN